MCGIFGMHSPTTPVEPGLLRKATEAFSYRGPDAEGYYMSEDRQFGLAHKRLSIIDLSTAANQPMADPDGRFVIVFNGEIYNFREIREELVGEGHTFRTNSDTEVLLYAFKQWGPGCLDRLNGMFSFAVFDSRNKKFFLARGRIGKKPLFYSTHGGRFMFSSELKGILTTGLVPVEIDERALNFYFSLGYVPGDMCLVRHVRKLPPGHYLEYSAGHVSVRQYWDVPEFEGAPPGGEQEAIEDLDALLLDSVRARLISDVPLGAFLSGGVDSSIVVACMRRVHGGEIRTFSVGFEGSKKNEFKYAAAVARHLETTHREITIRPNIKDDLEHVSALMDEPIFDSSLLPTYYLSKHTREHVTVALSGDGGDELFGGYVSYSSALTARRLARFAVFPLNRLAGLASSLLPEGAFGRNTLYGIFVGGGASCFTYPTQIFRREEMGGLLREDFLARLNLDEPARYRETLMRGSRDFLSKMCYADLKTMLADDILVKVDRASMFNSLEVRCPLLDYKIVEFAFKRVPADMKINKGVKKYLLKKFAARYLPADLNIERKQGFEIPADFLSKTYLVKRLQEFPDNEFISREFLEDLFMTQRRGRSLIWQKLFSLYFFLRWLETWGSS